MERRVTPKDNRWISVIDGRMDPELKAKWVAELRSGNHVQGQKALKYRFPHKKTQMCCLGVYASTCTNVKQTVRENGELDFAYQKVKALPDSARITTFIGESVNSTTLLNGDASILLTTEQAKDHKGLPRTYSFVGMDTLFEIYDRYGMVERYNLPGMNDDPDGFFDFNKIADIIDYFL